MPAAEPSAPAAPALEVRNLCKSFGEKLVLDGVRLTLGKGEIVGLVGENGAGKSTLLKIISGNVRPDSGSIEVRGRVAVYRNYREATRGGVFHIYQDLALVPTLSVYENVLLSHEGKFSRFGVIDNKAMRNKIATLFREFGHSHIDVAQPVSSFDFSTRQVIEIVKSFVLADLLGITTPVMLFDEPTAALTGDEVGFLMQLIAKTRERAAIIYVSHRLSEVLEISDRIYVLKDGAVVATMLAQGVAEQNLHARMVGRTREEFFYREHLQRAPGEAMALSVKGFSRPGSFAEVDIALRSGEIVGVAGLLGSGKSDLGSALAGDLTGATGQIRVADRPIKTLSIPDMSDAGLGYLPPDRRDSVIPSLSVAINMTLARLTRRSEGIFLDLKNEISSAEELIQSLGIKTAGPNALTATLSGGNQQKVVLARWLLRQARVLILDNPTNGVDAGAKEEIYNVLRTIAGNGVGILLISDDLPELIGLSNRILVMRGGAVTKEIAAPPDAKPREVDVVAHMV
jgi:ribose transport system ATP-binding protein